MRDPFWQSAKVLLQYKKTLAIALFGVLLSALAFGVGLTTMLPLFHILLGQRTPIHQLIDENMLDPGNPVFIQELGQTIKNIVPDDQFIAFVWLMGVIAVFSALAFIGKYIHLRYTFVAVSHASMRWRRRVFRRLIHAPVVDVLNEGTRDRIGRFFSVG